MRILWVKAGGLVPLDTGGKIRSYHLLHELARRHEVTLFTFYAAHANDEHPRLAPLFRRLVLLPLDLPAPKSFAEGLYYARQLFSGLPYNIAKFCPPRVGRRLGELLQQEPCDLLLCDFAIAGGVVPWEAPPVKVLFAHNIEAAIWRRHGQVARNPLWKLLSWREYYLMDRAERRYASRADAVVTVSEHDRRHFARSVAAEKTFVIPTGVDVEYFQPAPSEEQAATLVFTGSMDWLPNEDAVVYFVDRILPRIRQEFPHATLWIVGRRPSARLKALATSDTGIRVTGRVEDIRPYVRAAAVYIVPLRVGGGTRLKIFEALAMGKAVVSTTIGAEGLPVRDGENIVLADTPQDFASRVTDLLRDREHRRQLGIAARRLVERHYSWSAVARQFEDILEGVLRAGARCAAV
jgi:sugar transferase (PEP-CTERM/EpsH1 system associated)